MTWSATWRPRRVFVDTAAYYAVADPRDIEHGQAVAAMTRMAANRQQFFTTNFILAETHALILARVGRDLARRVLMEIDQSSAVIIRVSAVDERRARELIVQLRDKDYSLTDATSFAVMNRLRITSAFTFDRHFAQFGFSIIGPDRV